MHGERGKQLLLNPGIGFCNLELSMLIYQKRIVCVTFNLSNNGVAIKVLELINILLFIFLVSR